MPLTTGSGISDPNSNLTSDLSSFFSNYERRRAERPSVSGLLPEPSDRYGDDSQKPQRRLNRSGSVRSDVSSATSRIHDYGVKQYQLLSSQAHYQHTLNDKGGEGTGFTPSNGRGNMPGVFSFTGGATGDRFDLNGRPMRDALEDAMITDLVDSTKEYLPLSELDKIVNHENVDAEIRCALNLAPDSSEVQQLVAYVCGPPTPTFVVEETSNRKLFAILVLLDKVDTLWDFFNESIMDAHLPFHKVPGDDSTLCRRDKSNPKDGLTKKDSETERPKDVPVGCFNRWRPRDVRSFFVFQWKLFIPFLAKLPDNSVGMYMLDEQAIIPWTFYEKKEVKKGGFATVRRVKIHPDHYDFDMDGAKSFALKTLLSADEKDFWREFYALRKVKPAQHLVPLQAAFRRGDEFDFLFPWANGGNLSNLMKKEPVDHCTAPPRRSSRTFLRWIAQQCCGIAKGLQGVHDVRTTAAREKLKDKEKRSPGALNPNTSIEEMADDFGIHGDIKPENILLFLHPANRFGGGVLKISDFGLTNFFNVVERSQTFTGYEGLTVPADPLYRAPEIDLPRGKLCRKYDIWSLGCVFSELLTWVILGPGAVTGLGDHTFETKRIEEADVGNTLVQRLRIARFYKKIYTESDGRNGESGPNIVLKNSVKQWISDLRDEVGDSEGSNFLTDFLDFLVDRMLVPDVKDRANCDELCKFLDGCYGKDPDKGYKAYWAPHLPLFQVMERQNTPEVLGSKVWIKVTGPSGMNDSETALSGSLADLRLLDQQ